MSRAAGTLRPANDGFISEGVRRVWLTTYSIRKLSEGKAMASEAEIAEVDRMIKAFYKFAAVDIPFELTINE